MLRGDDYVKKGMGGRGPPLRIYVAGNLSELNIGGASGNAQQSIRMMNTVRQHDVTSDVLHRVMDEDLDMRRRRPPDAEEVGKGKGVGRKRFRRFGR